jgi:hypothetical protein
MQPFPTCFTQMEILNSEVMELVFTVASIRGEQFWDEK